MAKDRTPVGRNGKEEDAETEEENEHSPPHRSKKSKRKKEVESEEESYSSEDIEDTKHSRSSNKKKKHRKRSSKPKRKSRRKYSDSSDSSSSYSHSSDSEESDSESESSDYSSSDESDSEEERRRRKRRERKRRRKESEYEKEKRRKRKKKEKMKDKKRKSSKDLKEKKKKKAKSKGAVTNSWGKYGVIRETDMWNKRPEFNAWLAEVKKVNLESLANWEEKNMFKEFMEDHNTATFPSKKYYDLDAYQRRKVEKQIKKGSKILESERTVFNDEEQRRQELMLAREKQKEQEVENLKRSMQSGMAQAMKEQARLREEMAYQYKLGNFEAAAAIQRRLDPDVAM